MQSYETRHYYAHSTAKRSNFFQKYKAQFEEIAKRLQSDKDQFEKIRTQQLLDDLLSESQKESCFDECTLILDHIQLQIMTGELAK